MWSEADKVVIKQLESTGNLYCIVNFYCIFRKGHLLVALPRKQDIALATLSLYQPQSMKARCLIALIRFLIQWNLHTCFLALRKLKFCSASPIANLKANESHFGFLLGNPDSKDRRVIIARKQGDDVVIDKLGLSQDARESVSAEIKAMRVMPDGLLGLQELRHSEENVNWCFYTCSMVEGKSPQKSDDSEVLKILDSWLDFAHKKLLQDTGQWEEIYDYIKHHHSAKGQDLLDQCKNLEVLMGITHGDFAPWNIKKTPEDKIAVIDWEFGTDHGPACWDWIHYLIQRAILVENMSSRDAIQACRDWATTTHGKVFIERTGWGCNIERCLGCYLIYSNALGRFAHERLLNEWLNDGVKV